LAGKTVAEAVSHYGASTRSKLSNPAVSGAPEDQLRGPLEILIKDLAEAAGLSPSSVNLVREATLDIKTRPNFAVTVNKALVGLSKLSSRAKAPIRASSAIRTNSFSLWRDGKIEWAIIHLDGDVEDSGAKLSAPPTLLPLISDFVRWSPIPPKTAKQLAEVSARLCRFLRDEVIEQWRSEVQD
jgi:hypothetical protein